MIHVLVTSLHLDRGFERVHVGFAYVLRLRPAAAGSVQDSTHSPGPISIQGREFPLCTPEGKVLQLHRFFQGDTCVNNEFGGGTWPPSGQSHLPGTP